MATQKQSDIKVFIRYAKKDQKIAQRLYEDLKQAGVKPWIVCEDILPGQDWKSEIQQALGRNSYVIVLLSSHSISQRGYIQTLETIEEFPSSQIYLIPTRIEDYKLQDEKIQRFHQVDLFPSYEEGLERILRVLDQPPKPSSTWKKCVAILAVLSILVGGVLLIFRTSPIIMEIFNIGNNLLHIFTTPTATSTTTSTPIRPRNKPLMVPNDEAQKMFRLAKNLRPLKYIENDFEDQDDVVVIDHAMGLMWQKSGSNRELSYSEAKTYIIELNRQQFAGYTDWRLPTVEELMSLLESEKQTNGLYIDPNFIDPSFDEKKWWKWCWSADKGLSRVVWLVDFYNGLVRWHLDYYYDNYVHAVRSLKG